MEVRKLLFILSISILSIRSAHAGTPDSLAAPLAFSVDPGTADIAKSKQLESWSALHAKLRALEVEQDLLLKTLSDPRLGVREPIIFSLTPREPSSLYAKQNTVEARKNALEFFQTNASWFKKAEARYGVPQSVILALLQIETKCGKYTGRARVLPGLLRLAAAATPENIEANILHHRAVDPQTKPGIISKKVRERAEVLATTFLPHAAAAFSVAGYYGVEPLELRGSAAGAFGLPQFLPGNQRLFGVDADENRKVDLFSAPDAIFSVANFLSKSGWTKPLNAKKKRRALWEYNRSDAYISTALTLAADLNKDLKQSARLALTPAHVKPFRAQSAPALSNTTLANTTRAAKPQTVTKPAAKRVIFTGKEPKGFVRENYAKSPDGKS